MQHRSAPPSFLSGHVQMTTQKRMLPQAA